MDTVPQQLRARGFAWIPLDPEDGSDSTLTAAILALRSAVLRLFDSTVTPPPVLDLVQNGCVPGCAGGLVTTTKSGHGLVNVGSISEPSAVYAKWRWTVHSFEARLTAQAGAPFPWPLLPLDLEAAASTYMRLVEERGKSVASACVGVEVDWRLPSGPYAASVAFLRCVSPPTVDVAVPVEQADAEAWAAVGPVPEAVQKACDPAAREGAAPAWTEPYAVLSLNLHCLKTSGTTFATNAERFAVVRLDRLQASSVTGRGAVVRLVAKVRRR